MVGPALFALSLGCSEYGATSIADAHRADTGADLVRPGIQQQPEAEVDPLPEQDKRCADDPDAVTETYTITFEELQPDCPFGEGDNLEMAEQRLQARVEQSKVIEVPGEVCDIALTFGKGDATSSETNFEYDDAFWLNLNGRVLAASSEALVEAMAVEDGRVLYDWADVVGTDVDWTNTPPYCLGQDVGLATCDIPTSETPGTIDLQFDDTIIEGLIADAMGAGDRLEWVFITTGDNDPETDCRHMPLSFEVTVRWRD